MIGKFVRMGTSGKIAIGAAALVAVAIPAAGALAVAPDAAAETELTAEQIEQGRQLYTDWSCGACHALEDAGTTGGVGPGLDGNANLSHDFIVDRIMNGAGPMPSFGGQLTDEEVDLVAKYVLAVKK